MGAMSSHATARVLVHHLLDGSQLLSCCESGSVTSSAPTSPGARVRFCVIRGLKMPPKLLVHVQSHHGGNQAAAPRPEQPPLLLDPSAILMHPQITLIWDVVASEGQGDMARVFTQ